jgi:F0F1-type ATP synthase assembly protein I
VHNKKSPNQDILRYAGMATQMIATLGVAIFLGYHLDQKMKWKFPIGIIGMALLALISMFWKIMRETQQKNK